MTSFSGARTPKGAEPALEAASARDGVPVLFVSAGMSRRGGGVAAAGRLLLSATAAWARERGRDLHVLTLGAADEIPAGIDGEAFDGDRGRLARTVWSLQAAGHRHHVYDFLGAARIQGALPSALRARYVAYLYGIECWRPLRGSRKRAVTGATVLLACSATTTDRLRRFNPWAPPVRVLHLALPEDDERQSRQHPDQELLDQIGSGFVLIVGRLAPGERYKGHAELLDALALLARAGSPPRLVIAGEGEDRPRLEERARDLGIAAHVRFTGFVSDATLAELYRRCALFAMPSSGEGFGFVYLEAMRASKPCVALAGSAAAEIVIDGVTGRLVPPEAEALSDAVGELLGDPQRAAAMGAAGRDRWQREFRSCIFEARLRPYLDQLVSPSHAETAPSAASQGAPGPARSGNH